MSDYTNRILAIKSGKDKSDAYRIGHRVGVVAASKITAGADDEITRLQAENEALRERLENYEALKRMHRLDNYPNELSAKAWLLRKQAEAVKRCIDVVILGVDDVCEHCEEMKAGGIVMQDAIHDAMVDEFRRLDAQAAELERQSEGGE